jgi:hypothetical protein
MKVVALAALAAAGVIATLFADPRATPVTHPLWARMLLRALEMDQAVQSGVHASTVFATLSGRESRVFSAETDAYAYADGVVLIREGAAPRLSAVGEAGEVRYAVAIVQGGDYRLRARLFGDPAHPVSVEIAPTGGAAAIRTFSLVPLREPNWIAGGTAHLDPGVYTTSLLLPVGTSLESVELAPPCVNPVEPIGGWKPLAITTPEDIAVTAFKALDLEDALAPADTPIEIRAVDSAEDAAGASAEGIERPALRAAQNGLQAVLVLDLPEAGFYTLEAFVSAGNGQSWRADGCRKAVLCANSPGGWRAVMTQSFSSGRHTLAVTLAAGAAVERVRLVPRKHAPADYVVALRAAGFDPGEGPVSRQTAIAAMQFVRKLRADLQRRSCGDIPEPAPPTVNSVVAAAGATVAPAPARAGVAAPAALSGALLPPQERASPVQPAPLS